MNTLARELGVKRIIRKGEYIMGLFGGESREEKKYAGLVLEKYKYINGEFKFRLFRTKSVLRVPSNWLKQYSINIYNMIYMGKVYPFYLHKSLPILLSSRNAASLREFLRKTVEVNSDRLMSNDIESIRTLISELRQPSNLKILDKKSYYTVYRCARAFTATMIEPKAEAILESHVSALECRCKEHAFYYTAVLNYLAYKVIEKGRTFIRAQFAKPALAIVIAGLKWDSINKCARDKVIKLCEKLSEKITKQEFSNQRIALRHIAKKYIEFKNIVRILDSVVEEKRLEDALDLVSGYNNRK